MRIRNPRHALRFLEFLEVPFMEEIMGRIPFQKFEEYLYLCIETYFILLVKPDGTYW